MTDDLNAVRTAIEFEAKGAKYYAELRDAVSDPKEKDFFDLLAKIENEHYLSLKGYGRIFYRSPVVVPESGASQPRRSLIHFSHGEKECRTKAGERQPGLWLTGRS